jgi:hypothetical protein
MKETYYRSNRDKHARGAAGGGDGPGDASGYLGVGKSER